MELHPIRFYQQGRAYGFLSNFYHAPIELDGVTWPTTEHFYQAQKFSDPAMQETIRLQPGPGNAATLGRRTPGMRADWRTARDAAMLTALRAKFGQHPDLAAALLATGSAPLVEHTKNDRYWGDGDDGSGENKLGQLLEQVRAELAAQPGTSPNRRIYDWLLASGKLDLEANTCVDAAPLAHERPVPWSRVEGMLLGLAIGDALGNTSESILPGERRELHRGDIRDYLPNHHAGDQCVGVPSDDSQLTFWTLDQINLDGAVIPEHLAQRFCEERIFGIGDTVKAFLAVYKNQGKPWYESGPASAGNGAIMRITPLLVPYLRNPSPALWTDTALAASITHNDSASTAACVAFVAMLWELLGMDAPPAPEWWPTTYSRIAGKLEKTTAAYTPRTPRHAGYEGSLTGFTVQVVNEAYAANLSTLDACDGWYSGAFLMETMPSLLYILMRYAGDPEEAIVRAVNDTRDNDSVAALVGAAVGALHGVDALPRRWRDNLLGRLGADDDGRLFELLKVTKEKWGL